MEQYIKKAAVVAEIDDMLNTKEHTSHCDEDSFNSGRWKALTKIKGFLNTLEVIDPYEQCIQYPTVKDGIKAHAEVYSFNIESELFNQLTKEQQELWRNEIEQAVISGGEVGVELARDMRYKENLEVKDEVVSSDPIKAMTEALRMEYEKGRADVLRCIDPDEMVADFCSQSLSKTRSLASIYRQGIIDVLKRINNNEKTSIISTRSIDDGGVR